MFIYWDIKVFEIVYFLPSELVSAICICIQYNIMEHSVIFLEMRVLFHESRCISSFHIRISHIYHTRKKKKRVFSFASFCTSSLISPL